MKKPFFSLLLSFFIWLLILLIIHISFFKEAKKPQVSFVIDAKMVGDFSQKKQEITQKQPKIEKNQPISQKTNKKPLKNAKNTQKITKNSQRAVPTHNPLPEIPDNFRKEAFENEAIALFHISKEGKVKKVVMIKPCKNPYLNFILLKSLKKWRFSPSKNDFTQEIKVKFKVE